MNRSIRGLWFPRKRGSLPLLECAGEFLAEPLVERVEAFGRARALLPLSVQSALPRKGDTLRDRPLMGAPDAEQQALP